MTKRSYGQGRTARAPEARMTPEALEALKAILDKDGMSYADWLEAKITEDKKMKYSEFAIEKYRGFVIEVNSGSDTATAIIRDTKTGRPIYNSGPQPSRDQAIGKAQEKIDIIL